MERATRVLAALLLALSGGTAAAEPPRLGLPADCVLGETCYIQSYTDIDPGPGAHDHTCGPLSYDDHKGTDVALPDLRAMWAGVEVLAAAPGTVTGVRDGMADVAVTPETRGAIEGRECGNGVVISHGDGWETQYCHLRRGSVTVRDGQTVERGTMLGLVGLSGLTEFPHVHLSVRRDGAVVDPFAPDGTCGAATETLWLEPPEYRPGGLLAAGFSDGIPAYDRIKAGEAHHESLRASGPALVIWGFAFGGRAGDRMELRIEGPGGPVIEESVVLEKTQMQLFRAVGRRTPPGGWPAGSYSGEVVLRRDGREIDRRRATLTMTGG